MAEAGAHWTRQYTQWIPVGTILASTDTYGGPGWVHLELEAFQNTGFTPTEVLRMATLDADRAEGVDGDLDSLAVGKLADVLLLDGR